MAEDIEKVKEGEDHLRCGAHMSSGPCPNKAMPGVKFCKCHGGSSELDKLEQERKNNYRLGQWQVRLARHTSSPEIKSLRDEIGILRMMLEERILACMDTTELILQSHAIADLVMKIDKVVSSCHRLEHSMGTLLDKQAILMFATNVIEIVSEECSNEAEIEKVSTRLMKAVGDVGSEIV